MNRRTNSLLVLSLMLSLPALEEVNAQTKDNLSLYQLSLVAYVEAKADHSSPANNIVLLDNIVLHDSHVAEILPPKIGSSTIEYLNTKSIAERHKKLGKGFPIVEILPMRNSNGFLIVGCAEYHADVRHGKLILGVFGGYEVYWRFDCSKDQYVKVKIERWNALTL
ncbi:MAG: hypothetical protein LAP39_14310 [Acidobacteriia bacterium]|nr:hypothetical protein [Terriglobia bacterium]